MKSALRIQFSVPKYAGNHETGTSSIKIGNIRRLVPRLKSLHLNGETSSSPRISQIRKSHARVSPIKFFQFFQLLKILARRWKDALLRNKSQKGDILEYPNFPSVKCSKRKIWKMIREKLRKLQLLSSPTMHSTNPHPALGTICLAPYTIKHPSRPRLRATSTWTVVQMPRKFLFSPISPS